MEKKIFELLGKMQEQMNAMQGQMNGIQGQMTEMQGQMNGLQGQVNVMQSDISSIKSSVERIETHQNEDVIAILQTVNNKVDAIVQRQDEADNVIDVLAARTIRLEAKRNPR